MKLLDKLKNALFEEEYVEVEEVKKKEKPIAKKIIVDEPKPKKQLLKEEVIVEEEKKESIQDKKDKDFKFKAILNDDFIIDHKKVKEEKPSRVEKDTEAVFKTPKQEKNLYKGERKKEEKPLYQNSLEDEIKIHEYGGIAKQKERKEFRPSPIISPIYGILDQNYKKDDIVPKKEVRITSSYKTKNLDVDSVRAKAYGNSDDIFEEELSSNKQKGISSEEEIFEPKEEDNLLDISDSNTPEVKKVTMGDAEEYYSDLGLEYNIDYKDITHEKATGRRTDLKNIEEEAEIEDNLFDLIDSMYEEKKGE